MIVLFDKTCPLCCNLAAYMEKKVPKNKMTFMAWEDFLEQASDDIRVKYSHLKNDSLRVWTGTELVSSDKAWDLLIAYHPSLEGLNWLASKLNLRQEISQALRLVGHSARNLCFRCRFK